MTKNPLWSPAQNQIESTHLYLFMKELEGETGQKFVDYQDLWRWSVENQEKFWDFTWDFCGIVGDKGKKILEMRDGQMFGAQFFPDSRLNYAENLLQKPDDRTAIIFRDERGGERQMSRKDLYDAASRWQQAFQAEGVTEGDRIAAYMPNMPETITAALAAISLGAIWSSASPDFGVQGLIDRFGQIEPKILIAVDGYYYNGKTIDCLEKVLDVQPSLKGLQKTVIVPFAGSDIALTQLKTAVFADEFIADYTPQEITFNRVAFNHPLFIMFSSGTTGAPKCIVHGHGGTLIQHLKEHRLHCDVRANDKVFYFTTTGWMMWNWLISALACEATLLLFDGSPFYPDGNVLWEYTSKHDCTLFGTSAKYIDALKTNHLEPRKNFDLSALRLIASTGSPLVHESFDYVYDSIKKDVHLAPIYGGTDIVCASFGIGNPISPVWRGEMQGPALATSIEVYDEDGKTILAGGGCGELVLTKPIPSMPVCFWNDPGNEKYKSAYFNTYPGIWRHGDWAEYTVHNGLIVHGRADATLNPGGVRIGTAEIYRQVEQVEAVQESIAVGQDWEGDVRVILFVILKKGWALDDNLVREIKTKIRKGASPRHVPAKIIQISDIPRTKSGKITELAVRDVIHGRGVKNVEALANPEALALYKDISELKAG